MKSFLMIVWSLACWVLISRRLSTMTVVIAGFDRALCSAAPPILPVAPVRMTFMMTVQAEKMAREM